MADTAVGEAAEKALNAASDGVAAAREKFSRVSEDVQDRYRKVADDVRRNAERAGKEIRRSANAARESYEDAAKSVRKGYHKVRKDAARWGEEVGEYVRENPGKSILIAAGVGFLIGLIVRRRDED
jgi:ElaB/YqjD/DUF883 family membrane-anchored ribosome-binding protein